MKQKKPWLEFWIAKMFLQCRKNWILNVDYVVLNGEVIVSFPFLLPFPFFSLSLVNWLSFLP